MLVLGIFLLYVSPFVLLALLTIDASHSIKIKIPKFPDAIPRMASHEFSRLAGHLGDVDLDGYQDKPVTAQERT